MIYEFCELIVEDGYRIDLDAINHLGTLGFHPALSNQIQEDGFLTQIIFEREVKP